MEKRLGFIGLVVEDRSAASRVNDLLTEHAAIIIGRMGFPYPKKNCSVITLIVDASVDELGALSGKLGGLSGVSIRTGMSKGK